MRQRVLGLVVSALALLAAVLWVLSYRGPSRLAAVLVLTGGALWWLAYLVPRVRVVLITVGFGLFLSGVYAGYSNSVPQRPFTRYTQWGAPVGAKELAEFAQPASIPLSVPSATAFRVSVSAMHRGENERVTSASGLFVMAGRAIHEEEIPEALKSEMFFRYRDIYDAMHWIPNGCFALKDLGTKEGSVGVLAPYGLVGWQEGPPGKIRGRVYQSPDSSYDVILRVTGDHAEGAGKGEFGFGGGATLIEFFEGERLLEASVRDCFETALTLQKEGRGLSK